MPTATWRPSPRGRWQCSVGLYLHICSATDPFGPVSTHPRRSRLQDLRLSHPRPVSPPGALQRVLPQAADGTPHGHYAPHPRLADYRLCLRPQPAQFLRAGPVSAQSPPPPPHSGLSQRRSGPANPTGGGATAPRVGGMQQKNADPHQRGARAADEQPRPTVAAGLLRPVRPLSSTPSSRGSVAVGA